MCPQNHTSIKFTKVYKALQHVKTLLILKAYDYKRKRYISEL